MIGAPAGGGIGKQMMDCGKGEMRGLAKVFIEKALLLHLKVMKNIPWLVFYGLVAKVTFFEFDISLVIFQVMLLLYLLYQDTKLI